MDFVEVTFKDEFISRADMWRLKRVIGGKAVYLGQTISTLGIRARVKVRGTSQQPARRRRRPLTGGGGPGCGGVVGWLMMVCVCVNQELLHGELPVTSGVLHEGTKMTFR